MSLPSPLPDNPTRWEGWRSYNSPNLYERLCLSYELSPTDEQIEQSCRELLVWWQKKLPLKNQPSNPLAQLLRGGLDEAPIFLIEARTQLLDRKKRTEIDQRILAELKERAMSEFNKFLSFSIVDKVLREEDEKNLFHLGSVSGLTPAEMQERIDAELQTAGARREEKVVAPPVAAPVPGNGARSVGSPAQEFVRLLRLSGLDEDGMTDDQRDALCNMGENLGLTGGEAEDLIDEFLDEVNESAPKTTTAATPAPVGNKPPVVLAKKPAVKVAEEHAEVSINVSPLARAAEKARYAPFQTAIGVEMLFVPSGAFFMGSMAHDAAPNEQPVAKVTLSRFYISRFPITNDQFERFDPAHRAKRLAIADGNHPVVYVSSLDAGKFCEWLSARERRKFRLPTEAEWEYAARGMDGRSYPWGEQVLAGEFGNFADQNTKFAWRDPNIDDGYPETSPVGSYPRGASPFGLEDMAGNVWEWCADPLEAYKAKERVNPRGAATGATRVYRGGSWKSRATSLRATMRGSNLPAYASNDVGFRVVCEVD